MFQTIPLNKLVASPRNVRRHGDAAADAELKASIAAHGLLQNLVVRAAAKGKFEVEAGERRRKAMLALVEDKVLPPGHEVTCLVLGADTEVAQEASLAENFHRLAMNPADEAQAFATLIAGGASTEQVARRFGLTVRFVEGRLRLATLAPVVFDALAAGEITLDMAKAYGATSDQQIQARVFTEISGAYYSPTLSRRLVDELAMQRRDVLALHLASDPGLALDVMVFTLADADSHDWRARSASTIRGGVPNGPIVGFEPADAAATRALAELRAGLDETWRAGSDQCERFDRFRALPDEARAAWLGHVIARSLEASLNMCGERRIPFQDHLGALIGIDIAQWWRPTAANFFDRVPKQVILGALGEVGGPELAARYASVKKADLAASAERIFAGTTIAEVAERERALAWVPDVMRFGTASAEDAAAVDAETAEGQQANPAVDAEVDASTEASPRDLAA